MVITAANTLEQVKKASAEHSAWKMAVQEAIDTCKAPISVVQASSEHSCGFGRWLQENLDLRMFNPKHYDKVKRLHTEFHKELGNVLHLAVAGKRAAARERCVYSGSFAQALASLAAELVSWQHDLAKFAR